MAVWKRPGTKLKRWFRNLGNYHKAVLSYFLNIFMLLFHNTFKMLWTYFKWHHDHFSHKPMQVTGQERETKWAELWEPTEEVEEGRWLKTEKAMCLNPRRGPVIYHPELLAVGICSFFWDIFLFGSSSGFNLSSDWGMIRWIQRSFSPNIPKGAKHPPSYHHLDGESRTRIGMGEFGGQG